MHQHLVSLHNAVAIGCSGSLVRAIYTHKVILGQLCFIYQLLHHCVNASLLLYSQGLFICSVNSSMLFWLNDRWYAGMVLRASHAGHYAGSLSHYTYILYRLLLLYSLTTLGTDAFGAAGRMKHLPETYSCCSSPYMCIFPFCLSPLCPDRYLSDGEQAGTHSSASIGQSVILKLMISIIHKNRHQSELHSSLG
jgi:hypothetical protein